MARLLLVDDDAGTLGSLARVLRRSGHEVLEARNGREAIAIVRDDPPHVVLTDINMPEMDGIETILELRREWAHIPIIAISGGGLVPSEVLLDNAGTLGAFETIEKPVDAAGLLDSVERALTGDPLAGGG